MIEKASFRNFKSLRHVDLDFERLTVIVGPNASGKTSILEGLHLVLQAMPMPRDLLDDLDHGLHPRVQRKLIPMIRAILGENPDVQIIATTHSPYILDELDPSEVRLTWAGEDGVTSCARLDQHPDRARWKDEMWPGEFWSLVGERWVANGEGAERK